MNDLYDNDSSSTKWGKSIGCLLCLLIGGMCILASLSTTLIASKTQPYPLTTNSPSHIIWTWESKGTRFEGEIINFSSRNYNEGSVKVYRNKKEFEVKLEAHIAIEPEEGMHLERNKWLNKQLEIYDKYLAYNSHVLVEKVLFEPPVYLKLMNLDSDDELEVLIYQPIPGDRTPTIKPGAYALDFENGSITLKDLSFVKKIQFIPFERFNLIIDICILGFLFCLLSWYLNKIRK